MKYEAPAVTAITEVDEPLVGLVVSTINPQWKDEQDQS